MSGSSGRIDWEAARRRVRASQEALEALEARPERIEEVYQERAAALAGRGRQNDSSSAVLRVLAFTVGPERYGLELGDVVELLPFARCTPVPGGPPQLLGVMNVHGEIRSVVDLGRLLDLPATDAEEAGYVVLLKKKGPEGQQSTGALVGLRVDALDRIVALPPGDVDGPAGTGVGQVGRFLQGLTQEGVRLLNTEALLGHPIFKKENHG
jgi:purine-binding chemotaxis protein CheW